MLLTSLIFVELVELFICNRSPRWRITFLEPGIGQVREFEPRRVHTTRINSLGLFLVHKLTCGKRESVS